MEVKKFLDGINRMNRIFDHKEGHFRQRPGNVSPWHGLAKLMLLFHSAIWIRIHAEISTFRIYWEILFSGMKVKWLILQMVVLASAVHVWAGDLNYTNALLPGQKPSWPLPVIETPIVIKASFHSSSDVKKVRQGDWITTTYLITYDVDNVSQGVFEAKQLIFLCDDRWPTLESGIMLKALPFPFCVGTSGNFYLDGKANPFTIRSYHLTLMPKR